MARVLILGGTQEALEIANKLTEQGDDVITSLAGRTRQPTAPQGKVRVGGFGGAEGLANFLKQHEIDRLIDATHPFASTISANARRAADMTKVPLTRVQRPPWMPEKGDQWTEVETLEDAVSAIPKDSRVLLALGSQHIAPFAKRRDVHFTIRRVDTPSETLPFADYTMLLGKPGLTAEAEIEMLRKHRISHIVCRNSGGSGAYAKIVAARQLQIPVIIISRPPA